MSQLSIMLDKSVLKLEEEQRTAFLPPGIDNKYIKELRNISVKNEKDNLSELKSFKKMVDYLDGEGVPVVVVKGKGMNLSVEKYNTRRIIT